jgi:hypothetical protein
VSGEVAQSEVEWCAGIFGMLADGGMWGVPRSGLAFQRQGDGLHLISKMPYAPELGGTPSEWAEYQEDDFQEIKRRFDKAGIAMEDKTGSNVS